MKRSELKETCVLLMQCLDAIEDEVDNLLGLDWHSRDDVAFAKYNELLDEAKSITEKLKEGGCMKKFKTVKPKDPIKNGYIRVQRCSDGKMIDVRMPDEIPVLEDFCAGTDGFAIIRNNQQEESKNIDD